MRYLLLLPPSPFPFSGLGHNQKKPVWASPAISPCGGFGFPSLDSGLTTPFTFSLSFFCFRKVKLTKPDLPGGDMSNLDLFRLPGDPCLSLSTFSNRNTCQARCALALFHQRPPENTGWPPTPSWSSSIPERDDRFQDECLRPPESRLEKKRPPSCSPGLRSLDGFRGIKVLSLDSSWMRSLFFWHISPYVPPCESVIGRKTWSPERRVPF